MASSALGGYESPLAFARVSEPRRMKPRAGEHKGRPSAPGWPSRLLGRRLLWNGSGLEVARELAGHRGKIDVGAPGTFRNRGNIGVVVDLGDAGAAQRELRLFAFGHVDHALPQILHCGLAEFRRAPEIAPRENLARVR